ncbi:MAG: phosphoribosylamine--glycine ligase [Actinomycetota bacterium]|nr:phosphoribosylamine--glycine ligase [Actinomycetota bacterium]MDQ3573692.1 phosphoribosylamine--glycine ligase [Actinomycetota bacterium]
MRVCVVGGGGREHALAHVLGRTSEVVRCKDDPSRTDADLYVIGPERPLVDGLADRLRNEGRLVFGPGAAGARIEGSKAWMKEVLAQAGVPTARHGAFDELEPAVQFLKSLPGLYVVKTDGLAAGKGVLVTESLDEAVDDVATKLAGTSFGDAGRTVVIEEGLRGPELSLLAVCDGLGGVPLAPARDHKRLGEGNTGPNTGGMGAYSPVAEAGSEVVDEVMELAVAPTLAALRRLDIDYRGVLYAGLMLTPEGLKVLEFNVRFGDPEAQVVLPRYRGDLAAFLAEAAAGQLSTEPTFSDDACVTVVLAAAGYPASPRTGDVITGVEEAESEEGVVVFHAGVERHSDGRLLTAGGRVLDVTALGSSVEEARRRAYEAVAHISFPGMQYRGDIAAEAEGA